MGGGGLWRVADAEIVVVIEGIDDFDELPSSILNLTEQATRDIDAAVRKESRRC